MESKSIFSHLLGALASLKRRASSLTTITKLVENRIKSGNISSLKRKVRDSLKNGSDLGLVQAINGFYTLSLNSPRTTKIKQEITATKSQLAKTWDLTESDPELNSKRRKSEMKQDFVKLGKNVSWVVKLNKPETAKAKFLETRRINWKRIN